MAKTKIPDLNPIIPMDFEKKTGPVNQSYDFIPAKNKSGAAAFVVVPKKS